MPLVCNFLRKFVWPIFAILLASCGSSDDAAVKVVVIGDKGDPFQTGLYLSSAAQLTRAATSQGLVAFDAQGRVVPALAERWIVTDGGKSYIFRLRDGTWRDGKTINAEQVRSALLDAIRGLKGTALARDLAAIRDIRAMTERVIEIRLTQPAPHFLQLVAQPELGLRYRGRTAGPMSLERNGFVALLNPIKPTELGLPRLENWSRMVRQIRLEALPADQAVEHLNSGDADIVLGGTIANFPLTSKVGILRGTIQPDPVIGLFGLQVMNERGFLAEPENREAIAMAIDRQALITPFSIDGWVATTRIVAPGLESDTGKIGERWEGIAQEALRAEARSRVLQWRQTNQPDGRLAISLFLPAGPGSDLLFAGLAKDLAAIGIELSRAARETTADLRIVDDVASYPRAAWFLNRLSCNARRGACDKGADALTVEAMKTEDPAERATLFVEAEVSLTVANVYIPLGAPVRWSLVRGDVSGFSSNRLGWHPLMPMAMQPR